MRQQVTEQPENTIFLGWVGNLCLKRFDVMPEQMGQDSDGTALFLLANEQSYSFLRPESKAFTTNNERLTAAAREGRKVTVTVDIATADIIDVASLQTGHQATQIV